MPTPPYRKAKKKARVPHPLPVSPAKGGISAARITASLITLILTTVLAQTLTSPTRVQADSTSIRRGAELFGQNGCAHCHGENGIGGGKGPDLKNVAHHLKPEAITTQIHDGGKNMPPYGDALDSQQISDLVDYLRTKRKAAIPPSKP